MVVYFGDILVTGADDNDHLQNLSQLLSRLEKAALKLNPDKCMFMAPKAEYLGHVITRTGLYSHSHRSVDLNLWESSLLWSSRVEIRRSFRSEIL